MYYVAYGSNMNLDQMKYRCPSSKVVCNGVVNRWKFVFKFHADIVYTGKKSDSVPVVVWDIAQPDWDKLDRYEGFPKYYTKLQVPVVLESGEKIKALAYIMADGRSTILQPPMDRYFDTILEGCKSNRIDVEYLYHALDNAISEYTVNCELGSQELARSTIMGGKNNWIAIRKYTRTTYALLALTRWIDALACTIRRGVCCILIRGFKTI